MHDQHYKSYQKTEKPLSSQIRTSPLRTSDETDKRKVNEPLCYQIASEQTSSSTMHTNIRSYQDTANPRYVGSEVYHRIELEMQLRQDRIARLLGECRSHCHHSVVCVPCCTTTCQYSHGCSTCRCGYLETCCCPVP